MPHFNSNDNKHIAKPEFQKNEGWNGPEIETVDYTAVPEEENRTNYVKLVWRRKWTVLACLIGGALCGFGYVISKPPLYSATSVIEIAGINERFMGMNQVEPQDYQSSFINMTTQSRVITGGPLRRRARERVVSELLPITRTPSDLFNQIRVKLGVIEQEPSKLTLQAVGVASLTARAKGVVGSRLLEVSCESTIPQVANAFLDNLVAEYISQNNQFRSSNTLRTSQWLEGQVEEAKARVEQAEEKLQEFVQKEGLAFVLDQNTLADSKLRQLQGDLAKMQADRIAKQSSWDLAKSSNIETLPEILDDGRMREMQHRLSALRQERALLTSTLTPAHYKVQRIDAQVQELEQNLQREKAKLVQRIHNEYDAALERERLTSDAYQRQSKTIAGQAGKAAQHALLKREADMAQQVYNNLLQHTNTASVVAALPSNNVRVLEPGSAGYVPVSPKPMRDIPAAAVLGAGLGIGVLILLDLLRSWRMAKVFVSPGHIINSLNLPELGTIPNLKQIEAPSGHLRLPWPKNKKEEPNAEPVSNEMVTWQERASFSADSFRYTLISLLAGKKGPQLIVITSPGSGEGKTTCVTNLAISASTAGRRVLLIDGDLRRARLHKVLNRSGDLGLVQLLSAPGEGSPLMAEHYIVDTAVPDLFLLPAGVLEDGLSPSDLLFSTKLGVFLAQMKREFDVVLVDSPPAQHFPDSRLLAKFADGVVLVVRSGVTQRETVMAVAQRFKVDRIPILGTVLNDWSPREEDAVYNSYVRHGEK